MPKQTKLPPPRVWIIDGLFGPVTVTEAPKRRGRQPKRKRSIVVAAPERDKQPNRSTEKSALERGSPLERPISQSPKPPSSVRKKS